MKQLTKIEIAKSLLELLEEKNLNKITIEDISERAGINRQTFYYHFRDIIDLLEWMWQEDEKRLFKEKYTYDNWEQSFISICKEFQKNRTFIMNVYKNAPSELLTTHLYNLVYPMIYTVVNEKAQNYIVKDEDIKFIADFYKYAFVALVIDWIRNNMEENPEKIVKKVGILLQGTINHSLNNLGKKK